jgi:uncharacterized membrane protein
LCRSTTVGGEFLSLAPQLEATVSGSTTVLLSTLLFRTIIVAAVLLVLKYIYEGVFMMAGMLLLALSFLAYLSFTEARLLD